MENPILDMAQSYFLGTAIAMIIVVVLRLAGGQSLRLRSLVPSIDLPLSIVLGAGMGTALVNFPGIADTPKVHWVIVTMCIVCSTTGCIITSLLETRRALRVSLAIRVQARILLDEIKQIDQLLYFSDDVETIRRARQKVAVETLKKLSEAVE